MLMSSGVNYGIKPSIPHFLGICFGFPFMFILLGLGFGQLFISFPIFHQIIKYIGAAYLLYLSWKIARANPKNAKNKSKPLSFLQAIMFQWVNPKAWVMAIGAIATYTSLKSGIWLQIFIMSISMFIICFPCTGIWLFFGKFLQRMLKNERHQRIFNGAMGLLLACSVILIFVE